MNYYPPTETEQQLIHSSSSTKRLTFLQKSSFSRLQMISYGRHMCIKSINDPFQSFRLVIASLLIKVFSKYCPENQKRITYLKKVIYRAKLNSLINSNGIPRQILLKSVAVKLTEISIDNQSQKQVLKMFNCGAFFDQVIMKSFQEHNESITSGNTMEIEKWLKNQLNLEIDWGNFHICQEPINKIYLLNEGTNLYRPSLFHGSMVVSDIESENMSPINRDYLMESVSVNQSRSPLFRFKPRESENQRKYSNVQPFQIKSCEQADDQDQNHKRKTKKKNSREGSFWSIFCCGVD